MKFNIGDSVKILSDNSDHSHLIGRIGKIMNRHNSCYDVDFGKKIMQHDNNKINSTTRTFCESEITLHKARKGAKMPTHIVIWEEDSDPCRFCTSEKEALDHIDVLLDDSDVKKDSIILVEIKSCQTISVIDVKPKVQMTDYKI